ncbi:uncharacterized protein VP01_10794g1, partial [Puccinia sorghi]
MIQNTKLTKSSVSEREVFDKLGVNYQRAIGMLMYLGVCTRPDIAFMFSQLLQHLESLRIYHWKAVVHLLRYLAGTINHGIMLNGTPGSSN